MQNKHKKSLKDGEKVNWLRASGFKESHDGEFSGFSFCLIYIPDWLMEKPATQKLQWKPSSKKSLFSLFNSWGKGQSSKTENFGQ